jgi:hypothetical protein
LDPAEHIAELTHRITTLILYAQVKLDSSDWHGLSDVANDLRELEAEIRVWKELPTTPST